MEHEMEVTRDVVLPGVDRDAAWEVVSDPAAWLAEVAELELRPGAEGVLVLEDGEERHTVVEEVTPGERLAFWWHDGETLSTRVELTLDEVQGGTRVTVVESGFAPQPMASATGAGAGLPLAAEPHGAWPRLLARLAWIAVRPVAAVA
jgi:uncharacterized protein YndB with AHSA1/START domain